MQKNSPHRRENRILAAILKELRLNVGLNQIDLAARAQMRQSDVSKIETGVRQIDYLELRQWLAATDFDVASFEAEFAARVERMGLTHPPKAK
jgi:transcriptional regulator with XRE-family HTH domain